MKAAWTFLILAVAAVSVLSACGPESAVATPREPSALTFKEDIAPILEQNCTSCHSGQGAAGHLDLESLAGLTKGGEHGAVMSPGDSANSKIIKAIKHESGAPAMPPAKNDQLTEQEIKTIEDWIQNGAKP